MTSVDEIRAGMDLTQVLKQVHSGLLLTPQLRNYFDAGNTPRVNVKLRPHPLDKAPGDGWFHPSTHPLWSERSLYHYLAEPENLTPDKPHYALTMSRDFGSMGHVYVQSALAELGLLPKDLQKCTVCPPALRCAEPGVIDEEVGMRGHMDGILALPGEPRGGDLFELKTAGEFGGMKVRGLEDLDTEGFKVKFPEYYAQDQCYMKMSGRRRTIVVFIILGYPWETREFHVPYDPSYVDKIWEKLAAVRQAVADQSPGHCWCSSKERTKCRARFLCGGTNVAAG